MVKSARRKPRPVPEEEQTARYVYLLDALPSSVIERAHAAAFGELSQEQRQELLGILRPFLSDAEDAAASEDPDALARLVGRAEQRRVDANEADPSDAYPRDAIIRSGIGTIVASRFVLSGAVAKYFTAGAGSVTIDEQPPWVGELIDHESAPVDGGTMHHRRGVNSGVWF